MDSLVGEESSAHLIAPRVHQTSLTLYQVGTNVGFDLATVETTTQL